MIGGVVAACVLLSACATVTRGTRQTFNIQSTPSEAKVALSNGETCVTPCKLKIKRRPGFTATFTKEGFETKTVTVDSEIHGGGVAGGAGNILFGGVIGGIVDGTNGSLYSLSPNPLQVTLEAAAGAAPAAAAPVASDSPAAAAAPGEAAPASPAPAPEAPAQPGQTGGN
jgi:hypothetical protein